MKTKQFYAIIFCLSMVKVGFGQSDGQSKTHVTGYVNTIAEYTDLKTYRDADKEMGMGLSDAAITASYNLSQKISLKSTLVYRHYVEDIQDMLVEAYGTYRFSKKFNLSAGKFLTPLSPVNLYFYAPLNPSGVLPMVVSHHFLIPQSLSGLQFSGIFGEGNYAGYNLTIGNYANKAHPRGGIIGLQGNEDGAIYANLVEDPDELKTEYLTGGSARIYGSLNDKVKIGLNYFLGYNSSQLTQISDVSGNIRADYLDARKHSAGIDLQTNFGNLKVNGEYWYGRQFTTDSPLKTDMDYSGYYAEAVYQMGRFSPFVRYDFISDMKGAIIQELGNGISTKLFDAETLTSSYTLGVNYRPIYELMFKLEYRYINTDVNYSDMSMMAGPLGVDLSNPLGIDVKDYNYYLLSIIYSF
jgi:hypothetical protein